MVHFEPSETLKRLPRQYFTYLAEKKARLANEEWDMIDLGIGNPDLPTPQFIVEELKEAADDSLNDQYGYGQRVRLFEGSCSELLLV